MPVIDATIEKYKESKELDEFAHTNKKLEDQVIIERAKEMLMRQRNIEEHEAYAMLRTMAMQRNIKIVDLSDQLLQVAKMLTI